MSGNGPEENAPVPENEVVPANPAPPPLGVLREEIAREHFGWAVFFFLVGLTVLAVLLEIASRKAWSDLRGFVTMVATSLLTLLAAVIGYYYGAKKA